MKKRIYISADYSAEQGDREVVDELTKWGSDNKHIIDFVDMAQVISGSVSNNPDCRFCDLKQEFNSQINSSSVVIFVVGDKTSVRTAGSSCCRASKKQSECECTPYKQNANGSKGCKIVATCSTDGKNVGNINSYSFLQHEFEQALLSEKKIIILYNSLNEQKQWLPKYMKEYADVAKPFWIKNAKGDYIGDYNLVKRELGYE